MARIAGNKNYYTIMAELHDHKGKPTGHTRELKLKSVTTITGILDHIPPEWGSKVTVEGVVDLISRGVDINGFHDVDSLKGLLRQFGWTTRGLNEAAKERGSKVHAYIESFYRGEEIDVDSMPPDLEGYWAAFLAAQEALQLKPVEIEHPVFSLRHSYAGTLDLAGTTPEKELAIVDWKTSKDFRASHWAQVEGLAIAWDEEFPKQKVDRRIVVKLGLDGKWKAKDSDKGPGFFLATLALYRALRTRG